MNPDKLFAADVRIGLLDGEQKRIPSRYLYDQLGSALFEAITVLPEYGVTRADESLLTRFAPEVAALAGPVARVVELGSGSGRKTRPILESVRPREYIPIDVSAAALEHCRQVLEPVAPVRPIEGSYLDGLSRLRQFRSPGQRHLLLFSGGSIGNFTLHEAESFLSRVRASLEPGDWLLIGIDLVKPPEVLRAAYADAAGVTAAFNRNLLLRVNRELGGNFEARCFDHEAVYDAASQEVRMYMRARSAQKVAVRAAGIEVAIAAGERILTEVSRKYRKDEIAPLAQAAGFSHRHTWIDEEWQFAESLWLAAPHRVDEP